MLEETKEQLTHLEERLELLRMDDRVYYVVERTIDGSTVRYIERMAQEIDCRGGDKCHLADSYVEYTSVGSATLTGLSHLEGESVVVWADGEDVGTNDSSTTWTQTYTVSSGQITLASSVTDAIVGLPYEAEFEIMKLGLALQGQTHLHFDKKIRHIGLVLAACAERVRALAQAHGWPELLAYSAAEPDPQARETIEPQMANLYQGVHPYLRVATAIAARSLETYGSYLDVWIVHGDGLTPEVVEKARSERHRARRARDRTRGARADRCAQRELASQDDDPTGRSRDPGTRPGGRSQRAGQPRLGRAGDRAIQAARWAR